MSAGDGKNLGWEFTFFENALSFPNRPRITQPIFAIATIDDSRLRHRGLSLPTLPIILPGEAIASSKQLTPEGRKTLKSFWDFRVLLVGFLL